VPLGDSAIARDRTRILGGQNKPPGFRRAALDALHEDSKK
jgi:hypothetical protein